MTNLISFQEKKAEIGFRKFEELLQNPYNKDSSFKIKLSSLTLSSLLFIHDYLYPNKTSESLEEKMNLQFSLATNLASIYFRNEKEVSYKYFWWFNENLSSDGYKFNVFKLSNPNFYNYMLNRFENEELSGSKILDESITLYVQLFYNQINNLEDLSLFPDLPITKKKAMANTNQNLVRIVNKLEKGKILSFLPITRENFKYKTSL